MEHLLKIYYSEENEYDLPGPKLVFFGTKLLYSRLISEVEKLVSNQNYVVEISCLDYVKVFGTMKRIVFQSSSSGHELNIQTSEKIVSNLNEKYWNQILELASQLIEGDNSSMVYIELEGSEIVEDVTMIWEC